MHELDLMMYEEDVSEKIWYEIHFFLVNIFVNIIVCFVFGLIWVKIANEVSNFLYVKIMW